MPPFIGGLDSLKDETLSNLSTRQLMSVSARAAQSVVFDPKWKRRAKVRKDRAVEKRRAERNVYGGHAALKEGGKAASPRKETRPKKRRGPERTMSALTELEVDAIAKVRAARDVQEALTFAENRELGLRPDADEDEVMRRELANAYYEVGELIIAGDVDASVWALLPALAKKFMVVGTPEARQRELFEKCHSDAVPMIKEKVALHYDLTLDGTSIQRPAADKARERLQLRTEVEKCVRDACEIALIDLRKDEACVRKEIERLQRRLIKLGVRTPDLAVVPPWCKWTRDRGAAHGKPLLVQRAALKVQLDALRKAHATEPEVEEAPAPPVRLKASSSAPTFSGSLYADFEPSWASTAIDAGPADSLGPRGYELDRARKARREGNALPAIGGFGSPSKPRPADDDDEPPTPEASSAMTPSTSFGATPRRRVRKNRSLERALGGTVVDDAPTFAERDAALAEFMKREGLEDFLSPTKDPD